MNGRWTAEELVKLAAKELGEGGVHSRGESALLWLSMEAREADDTVLCISCVLGKLVSLSKPLLHHL